MLKILVYPSLLQLQAIDQAINSDVARALKNIPMGKVNQLSWSTRQYWSVITLERKSWKRVVLPAIQLLIQEISWSSRLIKKVDQENCQCDRGLRDGNGPAARGPGLKIQARGPYGPKRA